MDALIEFLRFLDESNIAYLLMLLLFLVNSAYCSVAQNENKRLRKLLRNAVKENGR
jgi:hypothetical protein